MSLTDERIEEIFGEGCLPEDIYFARAIEAEATKLQAACICGEPSTPGVIHRTDGPCYAQESDEPVAWFAFADNNGAVPLEFYGFDEKECKYAVLVNARATGWKGTVEGYLFQKGWTIQPVYTTPQPCPKCAEGMVSVTKEDANNYCRILTLLGMEEEGSPVEGVERLISLRDGMTCGDCNDTGWLENREEGRYPCTCMTEAEPYQILQAKCAELEQDLQTTADALAENEESEKAWEMLDTERVRYLNDVGDVLGQNNTDESLIDAAKRAMTTIEFQKKAWEADFVRMTRMEAAIERMRIAGGKDEFQKAFDDAKGLL